MTYFKLGLYQHYKDKMYEVVGLAHQSETLEDIVVYRAFYDSPAFGKRSLWVRPRKIFEEKVIIDGKKVDRFAFIT